MSDKVRFMYLRDRKGVPVACVAYKMAVDGYIDFGVSVHNTDDGDVWDRKQARWIAAGKLLLDPHNCDTLSGDHALGRVEIATAISTSKCFPTRAKKAAKNWLNSKPANADVSVNEVAAPAPQHIHTPFAHQKASWY